MFTLYRLTLQQSKSEKHGYTSKFLAQKNNASNTKHGPKSAVQKRNPNLDRHSHRHTYIPGWILLLYCSSANFINGFLLLPKLPIRVTSHNVKKSFHLHHLSLKLAELRHIPGWASKFYHKSPFPANYRVCLKCTVSNTNKKNIGSFFTNLRSFHNTINWIRPHFFVRDSSILLSTPGWSYILTHTSFCISFHIYIQIDR